MNNLCIRTPRIRQVGLEAGAHLHTIQNLLGHAQIASTMVYLHLTHQTSQDALRLVDELCQGLPG